MFNRLGAAMGGAGERGESKRGGKAREPKYIDRPSILTGKKFKKKNSLFPPFLLLHPFKNSTPPSLKRRRSSLLARRLAGRPSSPHRTTTRGSGAAPRPALRLPFRGAGGRGLGGPPFARRGSQVPAPRPRDPQGRARVPVLCARGIGIGKRKSRRIGIPTGKQRRRGD